MALHHGNGRSRTSAIRINAARVTHITHAGSGERESLAIGPASSQSTSAARGYEHILHAVVR
jgi:hypothetical protein